MGTLNVKIFTGITTSGKSTLSSKSDKNVIHIDDFYSYPKKELDINSIINFVKQIDNSDIVTFDGFFFNEADKVLNKIFGDRKLSVTVIFIYTSIQECYYNLYKRQFNEKIFFCPHPEVFGYDLVVGKMRNTILKLLNDIKQFPNFKIEYLYRHWDTYKSFPDEKDLLFKLGRSKQESIIDYILETSNSPLYQTIVVDGQVIREGTEKCGISWENIMKTGIDLKGKTLCDIGCFNGYFTLRAERDGGILSATGYDIDAPAIDIATKLSILQSTNTKCKFEIADVGKDSVPSEKFDVAFVMNMLHHVKRVHGEEKYLEAIKILYLRVKEIIFEINDVEEETIVDIGNSNRFVLVSKIKSHRNTSFGQRYILYMKKLS